MESNLNLICEPLKYQIISMRVLLLLGGPGSSVGIATGYGLDGPGIESQ